MEGVEEMRSETLDKDSSVLNNEVLESAVSNNFVSTVTTTSVVVTKTVVTVSNNATKSEGDDIEDFYDCGGDDNEVEVGAGAGNEHGGKCENFDGNVSVVGVDKKNRAVFTAGESSQGLVNNDTEDPKQERVVEEGRDLEKGGSSNENGGDSDASMSEAEDGNEDGEYQYLVGDYVWGKIKHHPWWPGRIYDPSDASETAEKLKKSDCYLVAYAGDGTFAWCTNSQLKPFDENFVKFSKASHSKNFLNAVESALEEIGQVEASSITCSCIFNEPKFGLTRPIADNYGVKAGVLVPDSGKDEVSKFDPAEILAELKFITQVASVENRLVLTLLKSRLSAFYRAKGGYELPLYQVPQFIIGLEDKDNIQSIIGNDDINRPPSNQDPNWLSSAGQPDASNTGQSSSPIIAEDKLYKRRKPKSITEIINEDTDDVKYKSQGKEMSKPASRPRGRPRKSSGGQDDPHSGNFSGKRKKTKLAIVSTSPEKEQNDGAKMIKEDTDDFKSQGKEMSKLASKPRGRPKKSSGGQDDPPGNSSGERKKTKLAIVSTSTEKDQHDGAKMIKEDTDDFKSQGKEMSTLVSKPRGRPKKSSGQDDPPSGSLSKKMKETKLATVSTSPEKDQNDGGESDDNNVGKEDTEIGSSPRERKKSKYLSHPFLQPERREKTPSSAKKESELGFLSGTSSNIGERMSKAASQLLIFPPLFNCSTETNGSPISRKKRNIIVDPIIAETDVTEVLANFWYAAIGHHFSMEPASLDTMKIFFSLFRSTVFCNGDYYDAYKDIQLSRKRKSPDITTEENLTESQSKKTKSKMNEADGATVDEVGDNPNEDASGSIVIESVKQKLDRVKSMVDKLDGHVSMETKVDLESKLMELLDKVRRL